MGSPCAVLSLIPYLVGSKRLYLQCWPDAVRRQQKPAPVVQLLFQSQYRGQEGGLVRHGGNSVIDCSGSYLPAVLPGRQAT